MKRINEKDWIWFGTHAHFICGHWCRFHMATQVGKYLISTVGEYISPRNSGGSELAETEWWNKNWPGEDVGGGCKYETMVFMAGKQCKAKECGCGLPELAGPELESNRCMTRKQAMKGHMKLCNKYAKEHK